MQNYYRPLLPKPHIPHINNKSKTKTKIKTYKKTIGNRNFNSFALNWLYVYIWYLQSCTCGRLSIFPRDLPFLYIIWLSLTSVTMCMPSGTLLFLNLDIVWNSHLFAISSISSALGLSFKKSAIISTWPLRSWKESNVSYNRPGYLGFIACNNRPFLYNYFFFNFKITCLVT